MERYNPRMRKVRLVIAILILAISLSLLAWGLWPAVHERRILSVSPTEMTLPTPSSFVPRLSPQADYLPHV